MEGLPNQQGGNFEKRRDPEEMFNSYVRTLKLTIENLRFPLLDVGASTGGFVTYCRKNLGHTDCFGVEPSDYRRGNTEGLVKGSAQAIPFPDESFEMIVSKNVMPMFKKDFEMAKKAVEEMLRILKPGGELVFDFSSIERVEKNFEEYADLDDDIERQKIFLKEEKEGITHFNQYLDKLKERVQSVEIDTDSIIKIIK